MGYREDAAKDFARRVTALGFRVFIARDGTGHYGFITDDTGARVLSFSCDMGGGLSGNYGPPSRESGTGWQLDATLYDLRTAEDVCRALYAHPPEWVGKGWRYFTTLEQHLGQYGTSSRYAEFTEGGPC